MFESVVLNILASTVLLGVSFVGFSIIGIMISLVWRFMITFSGFTSPILFGFGLLLIMASEATTQTGILLIVAAIIFVIGFVCVGGVESSPGFSTGGSFILLINLVILALVYEFYGFSSIEFLVATVGVFFTSIGETIFSTAN